MANVLGTDSGAGRGLFRPVAAGSDGAFFGSVLWAIAPVAPESGVVGICIGPSEGGATPGRSW